MGNIIILWRDNIIDVTESVSSLQAFEDWIKIVSNRRLHLVVTILGGLLLILIAAAIGTLLAETVSNGSIFGMVVVFMISAAILYQTLLVIVLTIKLHRYDLKLFAANPASSELISRLSSILGLYLTKVSIISAIWTLLSGTLYPTPTTGIVLVLIIWLPIIAVFVLNQSSLSSLVRHAKWKTLNEIQAKVEKLQSAKKFGDQESMDAINRLLDYHDRVNKTRNSALDLRAYLNFINSLLLPLLAFILGNLDLVKTFFTRQP